MCVRCPWSAFVLAVTLLTCSGPLARGQQAPPPVPILSPSAPARSEWNPLRDVDSGTRPLPVPEEDAAAFAARAGASRGASSVVRPREEPLAREEPLTGDASLTPEAPLGQGSPLTREVVADRMGVLESEQQTTEAPRLAAELPPVLRVLTGENLRLAEMFSALNGLLKQVASQQTEVERQSAALAAEFQNVRDKVEHAGMTPAVGLLLRTHRDRLPDRRICRQRIRFTATEMQRVQMELLELENDRTRQAEVERQVERSLTESAAGPGGPLPAAEQPARSRELLQNRRTGLDQLVSGNEQYLNELTEFELETRKLLHQIDEYVSFIDERVLWIRSAAPLQLSDFAVAGQTVRGLVDPVAWWQVLRDAVAIARQYPLSGSLLLVLFGVLAIVRELLQTVLRRLAAASAGGEVEQFWPGVQAFALTALTAAVTPAVLFAAGWWLTWGDQACDLTAALAAALRWSAPVLYTVEWLRRMSRTEGVGVRYFGWPPASAQVLQRRLTVLLTFGWPLLVTVLLVENVATGPGRDALGRLLAITGLVFLAVVLHGILRPRGGVMRPALEAVRGSLVDRTRHVWYLFGVAVPLLLAVVVATGYRYSADQLLWRWTQTLWLAVGLLFVQGLLARGIAVYCRRLGVRRKADCVAGIPATAGSSNAAPSPADTAEQEDVLLQAVAQLHRLLGGAAVLGLLLGGMWIWSETFPALQVLSRVPLWSMTRLVSVDVAAAGGAVNVQQIPQELPVTLGDLLLCLVTIAGTLTLARTIPDLLHVSVLQRLAIDKGARYAVVLMSRYALTVIGLVLAFRFIGILWSSLQWLVAAMTVGLGFGLQEIFANFVSGLIILFERPIRIGDVVTVNGTTGKVTRMQIRATTITDADRRELIVPNKKFITDEVINWTLSDTVTRVVLPIGIAYDCDPVQAQQLLLEIARANRLVLAEPEPSAIFKGFGSSTLDLELRVFIASRDHSAQVLHELNVAIERAFRAAQIEIAFPQQDLHIRTLPAELRVDAAPPRPSRPVTDKAA